MISNFLNLYRIERYWGYSHTGAQLTNKCWLLSKWKYIWSSHTSKWDWTCGLRGVSRNIIKFLNMPWSKFSNLPILKFLSFYICKSLLPPLLLISFQLKLNRGKIKKMSLIIIQVTYTWDEFLFLQVIYNMHCSGTVFASLLFLWWLL